MPMTWREVADLLGDHARSMSLNASVDITKVLALSGAALLTAQAKTKGQVDTAVKSFSETWKWPTLDQESSAMVVRRLLFAENLVRGFVLLRNKDGKRMIPCESDLSEPELIECLLIDAWERYGLLDLQTRS